MTAFHKNFEMDLSPWPLPRTDRSTAELSECIEANTVIWQLKIRHWKAKSLNNLACLLISKFILSRVGFNLVSVLSHASGSTSSAQSHAHQVQPPSHNHMRIRFNLLRTITCASGSTSSAQSHEHQVQPICTITHSSGSTSSTQSHAHHVQPRLRKSINILFGRRLDFT